MKKLWGYISAAAFLAIALMIGFLTLHVVFFYIIPIILAIIVGFWVMRMIGNLLSVTLCARKKLIRNTAGRGGSCWVLTDKGATQCRLYNQACRKICKTL